MDLPLTDVEADMLARAGEFAQTEVVPNAQAWEDDRRQPIETLKAASLAGFAGLEVPESFGGFGGRFRLKARLAEEMARHCFAFSFSLINHMGLAGKIARDAPEEIAKKYLPEMLAGEAIGCTALTEPAAGSDFAAISTLAKKVNGGWIINGEKAWITNAAHADLMFLYAQTDPAAGWRGVAGFLIDAREDGVSRVPPFQIMGGHAIGTGGFKLTDHFVPDIRMMSAPERRFQGSNGRGECRAQLRRHHVLRHDRSGNRARRQICERTRRFRRAYRRFSGAALASRRCPDGGGGRAPSRLSRHPSPWNREPTRRFPLPMPRNTPPGWPMNSFPAACR